MHLTKGEFNILNWLAVLLAHRKFDITSPIGNNAREFILNIPTVAMTANAFEEDRKKAFECGMNGRIVKPIDIRTVAEKPD